MRKGARQRKIQAYFAAAAVMLYAILCPFALSAEEGEDISLAEQSAGQETMEASQADSGAGDEGAGIFSVTGPAEGGSAAEETFGAEISGAETAPAGGNDSDVSVGEEAANAEANILEPADATAEIQESSAGASIETSESDRAETDADDAGELGDANEEDGGESVFEEILGEEATEAETELGALELAAQIVLTAQLNAAEEVELAAGSDRTVEISPASAAADVHYQLSLDLGDVRNSDSLAYYIAHKEGPTQIVLEIETDHLMGEALETAAKLLQVLPEGITVNDASGITVPDGSRTGRNITIMLDIAASTELSSPLQLAFQPLYVSQEGDGTTQTSFRVSSVKVDQYALQFADPAEVTFTTKTVGTNGSGSNLPASGYTIEDKKSKTATPLDENLESTVTLSVNADPTKGYDSEYDIVFVVDCSSLLRTNSQGVMNGINAMMNVLREADQTVKVGMVGFNNSTSTIFDLRDLNTIDASFANQIAADFNYAKATYKYYQYGENQNGGHLDAARGSQADWVALGAGDASYWDNGHDANQNGRVPTGEGTNLEKGIAAGRAMLQSQGNADIRNQYIVILTDGATFYYNPDDYGGPSLTTVGYPYNELRAIGNLDADITLAGIRNTESALSRYAAEKGLSGSPGDAFDGFIRENGAAIEASARNVTYSKQQIDAWMRDPAASGGTLLSDEVKKIAYKTQLTNNGTQGDYGYLGSISDFTAYPFLNMERGTYYAAKEMLELQQQGYHLVTIGFTYGNGSDKPASQHYIANAFLEWTSHVGTYYHWGTMDDAEKAEAALGEGETGENGAFQNAFNFVAANTLGPFAPASFVIDEMGYEEGKYDYDVVIPEDLAKLGDYLKVLANGEPLSLIGTPESTTDGGSGTVYRFGKGTEEYCSVTYYPESFTQITPEGTLLNAYKECLKLDVGKLQMAYDLQYRVKLKPDASLTANAVTTLVTNTNRIATLYPVTLSGSAGSEDFEKPELPYLYGSAGDTPQSETKATEATSVVQTTAQVTQTETSAVQTDAPDDDGEVEEETTKATQSAVQTETASSSTIPTTGDETPVGWMAVLALLSMTGILTALRRRHLWQ